MLHGYYNMMYKYIYAAIDNWDKRNEIQRVLFTRESRAYGVNFIARKFATRP